MKIAVFGAGGVGGYFGGLLAHAGHDVTFIARGKHLQAMQQRGLRVRSVNGDFDVVPAQATDDPAAVGPTEYLVVGLKHYHLADAAPQMRPLVGPDTTVVPLLNGVDAHETLIQHLGQEHLVGGFCSLSSLVEEPGLIRQKTEMRKVFVGELDRSRSERVERLVQAWTDTGVEATQPEDIFVALWSKFVFIASFGGVTSLARCTAGELRDSPRTWDLFVQAMREVEALGRARGIQLAPDVVESTIEMARGLESGITPSMQRDVAAGRPFELDAFSGAIIRMAAELDLAVPVHRAIDALLRPALARAQRA